jgi:hypothetical protein
MLSTNKLLMDQKLTALYDSAFRQAAYNAYYNTNNKPTGSIEFDADDDPNIIAQTKAKLSEGEIKREKDLKTDSNKFADEFVKQLKSAKLLETLSDEIDGHIKSMMLTINIPALLPTIISPMGPCTGTLTISEATGAQITIN